jgi:putative ABC transport system permease protein
VRLSARDRILLRDLWHLRGQVVAAALVVACGIAAFVSMRGTYESLLEARASYYQTFRFADVFAQLKRAPSSLAGRIAEIPGVATVQARVVRDVTLDVPGLDEPATGRLVSIPEHPRPMLNDLALRKGRYVEPGRPDQVIASEAFASANRLAIGDQIGAVINGRWKRLTVVGVAISPEYIYEVGGGTIFPDNRRFGVLWMGEEAVAAAFDMDGAFNDLAVSLAAGAVEGDVVARMDALLARYGGLGAYGREDQLSHRFISDEISQNRISSTYLPGIFLGVAAFLLHTVLSRLVSMQRAQIGLLKAFGYGNAVVGAHYLKLAGVIALGGVAIGTAAGMRLGAALTQLYRDFYRFPSLDYHAGVTVLGSGVAISLAAAAIGALGAVRRAALLPPAEAMRPEPPATFRTGLLERTGVARLLPSSARMIARNVGRHGWKSLLAVLGIACAVGLLVVGGFFLDAIRYLMKVQFEIVQRDDVTVLFTEAASARARHEVSRLPGVLRTEAFRSVPVRLRSEHRYRRVELTGLPAGGDLRQLIDRRLRSVPLPPDGLVLTRTLADLLHVSGGDIVTVEVLEGARPVRDLPVTALVDELVGVGAYMDRRALDRFLREGTALSGTYLTVDPTQSARLYRVLKRMPAVRAVAIRKAVVESFQDILNRSLVVSMTINALFACVIAFGVVYNGARIALSERGNELASLRVLGFSRREVAVMLLGEQGLFTLAAIPLGFALGVAVCWVLAHRLATELYRIPLVLNPSTFAFAVATVVAASALTGMVVRRRIDRLDLIAVLKTRE